MYVCSSIYAAALILLGPSVLSAGAGIFTYQGQLRRDGAPFNGDVAMTFSLWSAPTGGVYYSTTGALPVTVTDGLFSVEVDFPSISFDSGEYWIRISIEDPPHSGNYVTLSPRQRVTASPQALHAARADTLKTPSTITNYETQDAIAVTHVASAGSVATFANTNASNSDAVVSVTQQGTGRAGHFAISNVASDADALFGFTSGSGAGVAGVAWGSGPAVDGRHDGHGRAGSFYTSLSNNPEPTLYAQQEGTGRCGHFRITNEHNTLAAVAASTTGDGAALTGYTIGGGPAGSFEINKASSEASAVLAKTNGAGYAVSAESPNDVAPTGGGVIIVGPEAGANIAIDGNEIMARNNGATSTLFLNNDGGDVRFGGAIDIGYEVVDNFSAGDTVDVHCPAGKKVLSGGCSCGNDDVERSYPIDGGTGWGCTCSGANSGAAAICANVK